MKTFNSIKYFSTLLMVSGISFLATFWGDWVGNAALSVFFGSWFGFTLARPSPLRSRIVAHMEATGLLVPILSVHIGMLFFVNELTKHGVGYALSGRSYFVEIPWAAVSLLGILIPFWWARVRIPSRY